MAIGDLRQFSEKKPYYVDPKVASGEYGGEYIKEYIEEYKRDRALLDSLIEAGLPEDERKAFEKFIDEKDYTVTPETGDYERLPLANYDPNYERWGSGADILSGLSNIVTGTAEGFGYDLDDSKDLATQLAMGLILPKSIQKAFKGAFKGAGKGIQTARKTATKAGEKTKAIWESGPMVGARRLSNQFLNPWWRAGPAGTLFGKGKYSGRLATAPNLYMGYQGLFGDDPPFSERAGALGAFGDFLGLGQQTRMDYYSGIGGIDALYKLLELGGDTETLKKRKKEIDRMMRGNGKSKEKKESTKGKDDRKINITDW